LPDQPAEVSKINLRVNRSAAEALMNESMALLETVAPEA
jgi:hypothetical protein